MGKQLELYEKYFVKNNFERLGLFKLLRDEFDIRSALYLGSFLHITPAFVFPKTVFVDSDRRVQKFYADPEIRKMVKSKKQYKSEADFIGIQQNYEKTNLLDEDSFDLLISQYAGFVSQAGKRYLKNNGILIVNNSHGDASMAFLDQDYQLVGVINHSNGNWRYSSKNLGDYFVPKKPPHPSVEQIKSVMRGVVYTKSAGIYVFKLSKD
ncbi:MAG: hypothetical protein QY330_00230 [Candidatus Dojkabacteria bacterium]|uniref:Methyltransferase type 11 domain-containing protein n=2 Tax=Candidatus Dojkabacteria TaxID=74243 RepID=A0A136KKK1_9BACT|nr:MAG: hypothetical protein UZ20_WS6002000229 [candidate division WS6 bacterium OLB21]MBW7954069.1 hypothetical protein [Candidatus Dojkabacteria bacterium]WKZ28022.1 MAG: hypothetical protein QY330_00230 [Candidatus Dojkabacteria bacterium]